MKMMVLEVMEWVEEMGVTWGTGDGQSTGHHQVGLSVVEVIAAR